MSERLLRTHFVRQFLDNDLISPDADRHEVMATLAAVIITIALFVTLLMGFKYLTMFAQSPGRTAVGALSDRFFLYGCSMEVTALAALLSWNALSLDARDIAILGLLPVDRRTLVRAKLAAVAIVAAAFAMVLNAVTGILYPVLLVGKVPGSVSAMPLMLAAHAGISLAAGAFGFLAVLAARELLHAALGPARFARASVPVHAALTIAVLVSLLLLPGMSSDAARQWLAAPTAARWFVPPLWFVGLHEYLAGDTILGLPYEPLTRFRFMMEHEAKSAALYERARVVFPGLAAAGAAALPALASLALPAYWWNNRTLDGSPPAPLPPRARVLHRLAAWIVNHVIVRHPVAQAGFWLALRCVSRSLPHRMAMAFAAAIGIAAFVAGLPVAWEARATEAIPLSALTPQIVLLGALVVAFRHGIGVAADLRANWVFRTAWLGTTARYITGVRRFAVVGVIFPAAVLLVPIHGALLGPRLAVAHALLGFCVAIVLLQLAFLQCDRLPFAVPRSTTGNLKTRGPVYLVLTVALVYGIALLVRLALQSRLAFGIVVGAAGVLYAVLGWIARRREHESEAFALDDMPEEATQRLGLA